MIKLIKTMLLVTVTMVIVLTSCSQDVMVEDATVKKGSRQEIEFHLDMQSRATDRTIANLDTIWVYADDGLNTVFESTPFIKDAFGRFRPEEKILWPEDKDKINFTAFWPNPGLLNINTKPGQVTISHSTPSLTDKHYDLITASTTVDALNSAKGIPLKFSHAFAQIEFRAKIGEEAEHRLEIFAMSLAQTITKGEFNVLNNSWTLNSTRNDLFSAPENIFYVGNDTKSITDKTGSFYIMPQTFRYYQFDGSTAVNRQYIRIYGKVYDDEGTLIYPLNEWKTDNPDIAKQRFTSQTEILAVGSVRNIEDCGRMMVAIGGEEDLQILPGHKYIFTIDFTNGVGYISISDPQNPQDPILNAKLTANVTMESWSSSEFEHDAN